MQRFGRQYSINGVNFKIVKKLDEGAYGDVFQVVSVANQNKFYAVKQMRSGSKDTHQIIENEIQILLKVSKHVNIVDYHGFIKVAANEFMLLMEFCPFSLSGILGKQNISYPLPIDFIIKTIGQLSNALDFMHNLTPILIHRDIKIENTLINASGIIKICDFGSCTRVKYLPEDLRTTNDKLNAEDDINRNTTPLYRSPEMLDMYNNFPVDEKSDIWALCSLIYKFLTGFLPFESGEKLAICNINYNKTLLTKIDHIYSPFVEMIHEIFIPNPYLRPAAIDLMSKLILLSERNNINIQSSVIKSRKKSTSKTKDAINSGQPSMEESGSQLSGGTNVPKDRPDIFSKMKKHTEQFVSRMKDVGNVVKNSISNTGLMDMANNSQNHHVKQKIGVCKKITSKLLIISTRVSKESIRESLENLQATSNYMLVSFSDTYWLDVRPLKIRSLVISKSTDLHPGFERLVEILSNMLEFLQSHQRNALVFVPGENIMRVGFYICAILLITQSFNTFEEALGYFTLRYGKKRISMPIPPALGSMKRYCNYIKLCAGASDRIPALTSANLTKIKLRIPNAVAIMQHEIKPVIEVYNTHVLCFSLVKYTLEDDDTIAFEAGYTFVGSNRLLFYFNTEYEKHQIFNVSLHTCFLPSSQSLIILGEDFDPCSYSYISDLQNWSLEMSLFFVPSSVVRYLWDKKTSMSYRDPSTCFKTYNQFVDAIGIVGISATIVEEYRNCLNSTLLIEGDYFGHDVKVINLDFLSVNKRVKKDCDDLIGFSSHNDDSEASRFYDQSKTYRKESGQDEYLLLNNNDAFKNSTASSKKTHLDDLLIDISHSENDESGDYPSFEFYSLKNRSFSDKIECDVSKQLKNERMDCFNDQLNIVVQGTRAKMVEDSANMMDLLNFNTPSATTHKSELFFSNENPYVAKSDKFENKVDFNLDQFGFIRQDSTSSTSERRCSSASKKNTLGGALTDPFVIKPENDGFSNMRPFKNITDDFLVLNITEKSLHSATKNVDNLLDFDFNEPSKCNTLNWNLNDNGECDNRHKPRLSENSAPKVDVFQDLLSDTLFSTKSQNNLNDKRTLNEMHQNREESLNINPVRRKVDDWAKDKQKDLRKLLASLHLILWDGVTKWSYVRESQLQTIEEVKFYYKKACLIIHPDKMLGSPHAALARNIFTHISEAYKIFQASGFGK